MVLDQRRRDEINRKADEVRVDYRISEFPIEPIIIAKQLSIDIIQVDFMNCKGCVVSGGIIKNSDTLRIYVNSSDCMYRKRFTIAHELGHYFLNHLDNKGEYVDLHRESYYVNDKVELEADEFAGCLLMPKRIVEDKFNTLKIVGFDKETIVNKLAGIFFVSQTAMKCRLKNIKLI